MNVDKTRSLARHTAWYDGEPKNPKWSRFNPVSKHKSKHKNRIQNNDEENQIKQVPTNHSETCVAPSVEIKRIQDNIDGISMAQHADTMPLPSTKLDGYSSSSHATDSDRLGISQDSGTGTTDVVLSEKLGDDGKPRKRRLPFPHHQSGIAAEPEGSPASNPKPPRQAFTAFGQIRATIFNSWLNVLFVFIPIGIGMHFAKVGPVVVFTTNFVAIVPLAAMLSYATEEIALHTGETIGGLLNATFG